MRYEPIHPDFFIRNRKKISDHLLPNSLVIFHANDLLPKNTDGVFLFVQNSDLFYLSGIDQEETILILYPDAMKNEWKEILFIKSSDALSIIWNGKSCTQEEAQTMSGINHVHFIDQFYKILHTLMGVVDCVYLNSNEHPRADCTVQTRDRRFITWMQEVYPLHTYKRIAPIMQKLRGVKEEEEIALIQQACNITEAGFRSVLGACHAPILEYEVEALFAYAFIRQGSKGFAYDPIIASGADSCTLHYIKNNKPCLNGELLLLDVGAEYANYSADMTRVLPIGGRFNPRQKEVYNAVLRILHCAQNFLMPGISFIDYYNEVIGWVEKELLALKLIDRTDIKNQTKQQPAYKKYFMHGISHHLGLSTHDLGDTHGVILPNMVLTVEPGIYIREEGLGVRLENNIVIKNHGIENLMANIPIEVEEIETLMQKG